MLKLFTVSSKRSSFSSAILFAGLAAAATGFILASAGQSFLSEARPSAGADFGAWHRQDKGPKLVGYLPDYDGSYADFAKSLDFSKMTHLYLAFGLPPFCNGICTTDSDMTFSLGQTDADIKKRKAEQALNLEGLQQRIRVTRAELEKAKLDSSASEVRTAIDIELLKLSVQEQEATLKQQLADLPSQKISNDAEIRGLELTKDRHVRHRARHAHDVEKFTIHAPIGGLVVMQTIWRGTEMGQVQVGDQVSPGQPFMGEPRQRAQLFRRHTVDHQFS